jgi:putative DNA primase/helicase
MKSLCDDIRKEANSPVPLLADEDEEHYAKRKVARKEALLRWAVHTGNSPTISRAVQSAQTDPRILCRLSDFDLDPFLLNCPNGVVDLKTGDLLPHDKRNKFSKLCSTEYHANASHPVWDSSLAAYTRKHPDLLPFLKRLFGYCAQGDKVEERIVLIYGPASTGKGTFIDSIMNAFGSDYACTMASTSVERQPRTAQSASGDLARLSGMRLVVVSEFEKNLELQESFMKLVSGNDSIVARAMYESEVEFKPTHQMVFQSNHRPKFDSTDSGNLRRYIEVPFVNNLKEDPLVTFDPKLKLRMRRNPEYLQAVLTWCVQGCVEWCRDGLLIPQCVELATQELFAANDFLAEFLADLFVKDSAGLVRVEVVSDAYKRWCDERNEKPATGRSFNQMMKERGFDYKQKKATGHNKKHWSGIRLKEHKNHPRHVKPNTSSPLDMVFEIDLEPSVN